MAKERFKFGDKVKVVPNSPKFWLCGNRIWTVRSESQQYVIAHCSPNDKLNEMHFLRSDIKRVYPKQMLFDFMSEN